MIFKRQNIILVLMLIKMVQKVMKQVEQQNMIMDIMMVSQLQHINTRK